MKRIIVSVTNDLTTDQRVHKTCSSLCENGFEVLLVGRKFQKSIPIHRQYQTKRFRLLFNKGFLFYAEYQIRLFFFLFCSRKNALYSNDLDTLLPNFLISRIQQKKLIFDSHELFSEIPELVHRKKVKNSWLLLENWIIPKLRHVITVSNSIKNHYQNLYGVTAVVVRNIPEVQKIETTNFDFDTTGKKIILYQGAINMGRGIELMIQTMPLLKDYFFIVIGEGDILAELKKKVDSLSLGKQIIFLGKKTPEELKKLTPNATIGMSLEEDLGLNYKYALPNKIFDYIHAKVPIIVSNLPEMKSIVKKYSVGEVLTERTPEKLAHAVIKMSTKNYEKKLNIAVKELHWSKEKKALISVVSNLE